MGGVQNIALGKHVNAYNGNYYNFTDGGILKISKKEREIYEKGLENDFEVDEKHKKVTSIILEDYSMKNLASLQENIVRAGSIRGFLG